ncbi:MAG: hypothetical protein ACM3S4_05265 [Burkholderiales bacterium]
MNDRSFLRRGPLRVIAAVITGIIAAAAVSLITAVFVMLLWNWVVPDMFGLGVIGYWQAFGLALLVKLLAGGFARRLPPPPGRWQKHWRERRFGRFCLDKRFDEAYEEWWESEGSAGFEEYLKKKKQEPGTDSKEE